VPTISKPAWNTDSRGFFLSRDAVERRARTLTLQDKGNGGALSGRACREKSDGGCFRLPSFRPFLRSNRGQRPTTSCDLLPACRYLSARAFRSWSRSSCTLRSSPLCRTTAVDSTK
jgi:hypothetical protein